MDSFIPRSSSSWLPRQIGPLPTRVWCHLRQPDASSLQRFALLLTHTFRCMLLSFLQSPRRALLGNLLCTLAYSYGIGTYGGGTFVQRASEKNSSRKPKAVEVQLSTFSGIML